MTLPCSRRGLRAFLIRPTGGALLGCGTMCQGYDVEWLAIFGSATPDDWNPTTSDVDFLVRVQRATDPALPTATSVSPRDWKRFFGRSIDLVTDDSIENPYFGKAVDDSRTQLYAV